MSEDLVARQARALGRYGYLSLGSTTLAQLRASKFIRNRLNVVEERRKPDGIVFLPLGGIKAVIEVKQPKELTVAKIPAVVKKYAPIASAVCKLLIITDGKKTLWYNALSKKPLLDEDGAPVKHHFDLAKIDAQALSPEEQARIVALIEKAEHSLTATNNKLEKPVVKDPSGLARSVWQKIWVNTGKEPEKCLYNVVEIFVFKFLSDIGVLSGNNSFRRIVELIASDGVDDALRHYAQICRDKIRSLFPPGQDRTTIINGTIFVNEAGRPNFSQAGLFAEVIRAFQEYDDKNGSLRYIDRQFKTRLYESFLRQQAGIRSLGQFFTPRNVVQAMVRMSNAASLRPGDSVCDPFCGVGGFLLEAIAENQALMKQFRPHRGKIIPQITFKGYDKGTDEKDDERTIILAKANMLVYLSDLLSEYHSDEYLKEFADKAFNSVFTLLRSNLGTYELVSNDERFTLILTNPPYVTSGSGSIKAALEKAGIADYYSSGRGTEALAIQWVVNHLDRGGESYVVVPDGLLNQPAILDFVKRECVVLCVIPLPTRTFYSTPKKTYILGLRRKDDASEQQASPVFAYLISEIGESRDARRVPIDENDLSSMETQFGYFKSNPVAYKATDPRCRLLSWSEFDGFPNWLVDRVWTHDEKVELGIAQENFEVDIEGFRALLADAQSAVQSLQDKLQ